MSEQNKVAPVDGMVEKAREFICEKADVEWGQGTHEIEVEIDAVVNELLVPFASKQVAQVTAADKARIVELEAKYNELIYAVGNKHEGESRHETALRYIREAETVSNEVAYEKYPKGENK